MAEYFGLLIGSELKLNLLITFGLFGYLRPCLLSDTLKIVRKDDSIYFELVFALLIGECYLARVERLTLIISAVNKRCRCNYLTCLINVG